MKVSFPYGKTKLYTDISGTYSQEILSAAAIATEDKLAGIEIVRQAMANPIGTDRLDKLAQGKKTAVIIISDHTRPVPSREILPLMLEQMRAGNPEIDITLLVATGCHRGSFDEELRAKLGDEIFENEKILVHDCMSPYNVEIGILPSGAPLVINKIATDADLLVSEGFIEPHFFAGFSGGRKSVLPGICDRATVYGNHCSEFVGHSKARTGVLEDNPIHTDMIAAARMAGLAFIVNVILDENHSTAFAFAGDAVLAHRAGCDKLKSLCCVSAKQKGDIIITSNGGAPLDQNIYQAVKCMSACEACAAENAVFIICAECADGTGSQLFYEAVRDCKDMASLLADIEKVPQSKTTHDQWQYQVMARIMAKFHVIMVCDPSLEVIVEDMKMEYAPSIEAAMSRAIFRKGPDAHIIAIPDGVGVIVEK